MFRSILAGMLLLSMASIGTASAEHFPTFFMHTRLPVEAVRERIPLVGGGELLINLLGRIAGTFAEISEDDPDHAQMINDLGATASSLSYLNTPVNPPPIDGFGVIPTTSDDYNSVFGYNPSPRQLEATSAANAEAATAITTNGQSLPQDMAGFNQMLSNSTSAVFTIIGHNVAGDLLVPPNIRLSLNDMAQDCSQKRKLCVFISCNSQSYVNGIGVTGTITFAQAVTINDTIKQLAEYAAAHQKTRADLMEAIVANLNNTPSQNYQLTAMTVAVGSTVFVGMIVVDSNASAPS